MIGEAANQRAVREIHLIHRTEHAPQLRISEGGGGVIVPSHNPLMRRIHWPPERNPATKLLHIAIRTHAIWRGESVALIVPPHRWL
jgi:hypothetical protein